MEQRQLTRIKPREMNRKLRDMKDRVRKANTPLFILKSSPRNITCEGVTIRTTDILDSNNGWGSCWQRKMGCELRNVGAG